MNPTELLQKLIRFPSVTSDKTDIFKFFFSLLEEKGFRGEIIEFTGDNSYPVENVYAKFGSSEPNFCFAGHLDVVPVGAVESWSFDPFGGEIHKGKIYGRGAVDMKGGVAAQVCAAFRFINDFKFNGSISFLITGDEEAEAINGTKKVLKHLEEKGEKLSACLDAEPTSKEKFGDMIKNGRRGTITFNLTITGIQGHIAYPKNTDNPITRIVRILNDLKNIELDKGNQNFEPSNLEVTTIDVGNKADNVIPEKAHAQFNVRFNDHHNFDSLIALVEQACKKHADGKYNLRYRKSGESFITTSKELTEILFDSVKEVVPEAETVLSTSGGTSDARFIKNYCPVIEFGLLGKTAHKVDEHTSIEELEKLTEIYYRLLKRYFKV